MWPFDINKKRKEVNQRKKHKIVICSLVGGTFVASCVVISCTLLSPKKNNDVPPPDPPSPPPVLLDLEITGPNQITTYETNSGNRQYSTNASNVIWTLTGSIIGKSINDNGLLSWDSSATPMPGNYNFTIFVNKDGYKENSLFVTFAVN
jgi:hypothetical protein